MSERVYLQGSEDVYRAASMTQSAASEMQQAARNIEGSLERQQRFMDEWLQKFEQILTDNKVS
jgi:DNA-binding SARP family transcriptional activator